MIGYTIFGTNDLDRSSAFYDTVFGSIGYKRCYTSETFNTWGTEGMGDFAVSRPFDGNPATNGNGTMIAILAGTKENVARGHATALEAGATDEGAPGYRGDDSMKFYAAYFRDLDNNKIALFTFGL